MFTSEKGLRHTVRTGDISTTRTLLRGISGIDISNSNSLGFCFVDKELLKLREVPFMQFSSLFLAKSCLLSDAFQLLENNSCPFRDRPNYLLRNLVIGISAKTVLLPRNSPKVSFGRFATTRLQYRPQFLIPVRYLSDFTSVKEFIIGCYGYLSNTTINAYNLACRFWVWNVLFKNYMQEYTFPSQEQISRAPSPIEVSLEVFGNGNGETFSAVNSKNRDFSTVKPDIITSGIKPYRALFGFRTSSLLPLFKSCLNRFKGFCSFHSGRNSKLRGKMFLGLPIGLVMQRHSVSISILPSCFTDIVKGLGISLNSWLDNLRRNIQFNLSYSCESHIHIITHYPQEVKS